MSGSVDGRRSETTARSTATMLATPKARSTVDPPSISPNGRATSSRRTGRVLTKPPSTPASYPSGAPSAARRAPRGIDQGAHEDVCARPDAEGPVAAEPPAGVLVGRGGAHETGEECRVWVEFVHRQVVDRLRKAWLGKAAELFRRPDRRELDRGSPELADEAQRNLLSGALAEQDPASLIHGDRRKITHPHRLRRLRWPFPME